MPHSSDNRSRSHVSTAFIRSNDVFISYSRKDKAFVETLEVAFRQASRDPWIDWDDIRKGEDWWQSIQRGIEQADTFVFILSPDSVASEVCRDEVEYATQCHKRFLPLVRREGFEMSRLHPSISRHNWLFFRETDDFKAAFQELLTALDTDLDYVHAHTRLLVRSHEWQTKGCDRSYLLRGTDLIEAQQWLTQGLNKEPRPTEGQVSYINASLEAKAARLKARQQAKWVVVLTTVLANLAFVSGGLYWLYTCVTDIAMDQAEETMRDTLTGAITGIDGDEFAALAALELPPDQDNPSDNPLYQRHQAWLQTINRIAPSALPVTYIPGANADEVLIIGDIAREGDVLGSLDPSYAYNFRELKSPDWQMLDGLQEISLNFDPYVDETGTWIAIYGPIENAAGEMVGAMELEYNAAYVEDIQGYIRSVISKACLIAAIWLAISSWLILRATRPPQEH
ncbi:histidine kinase [Halomicronema hongdechloris C2206]|uniref:Histidine kinase n=1 Tax=Halomicronema hongdechloris C2206 TaxID=1641165 RepID=A0A1Z3HQR8_9CYAN|nr:toll/interleukin-1 receptor domain-containing protein [Halomicronema hongdechloris]ASC72635.1 histidine kinase [Halomicronema hongdechloris C2206]